MKHIKEENKRLKDLVRELECNIDKMDRLAYGKLVINHLPKEKEKLDKIQINKN